jgi:hypothetical protein
VYSDVVRGDRHTPRPTTVYYRLLLQLSISQKALETLREDGNVMPKHVAATIHN